MHLDKYKKYIPNVLSTIRLIMTPGLPYFFTHFNLLSTSLYYGFGNLTDAIDGSLARRWKVQSKYGKIVDPIADKLFNLVAMSCMTILVNLNLLILLIPELVIATISTLHAFNNIKKSNVDTSKMKWHDKLYLFFNTSEDLDVSYIGKIKTVLLGFCVFFTILTPLIPTLTALSMALLGITAVFEAPVIIKYGLEYIEDLDKINPKGTKLLSKIDKLDEKFNLSKIKKKIIFLQKKNKQKEDKQSVIDNSINDIDDKHKKKQMIDEKVNAKEKNHSNITSYYFPPSMLDSHLDMGFHDEDIGIQRTLRR